MMIISPVQIILLVLYTTVMQFPNDHQYSNTMVLDITVFTMVIRLYTMVILIIILLNNMLQ